MGDPLWVREGHRILSTSEGTLTGADVWLQTSLQEVFGARLSRRNPPGGLGAGGNSLRGNRLCINILGFFMSSKNENTDHA